MTWWWLSFCDPHKPKGEQFLGVSIVQAPGEASAVMEAHRLGVNPGGEVALVQIPQEHIPAETYRNRLLTLAEAAEAGRVQSEATS